MKTIVHKFPKYIIKEINARAKERMMAMKESLHYIYSELSKNIDDCSRCRRKWKRIPKTKFDGEMEAIIFNAIADAYHDTKKDKFIIRKKVSSIRKKKKKKLFIPDVHASLNNMIRNR